MAIFKGACTALVTPMNDDFTVNYEKLDELIEMQIEGGIDALCICGTTGEASTLSHEEHIDVIARAVKAAKKRVPIIAGAGSNSTETAIYLSKEAERVGADALLHVSQISRTHVDKPSDALSIGQEITAKIVDLNEAEKKISLSMKVLEPEHTEEAPVEYSTEDTEE